MKLVMKFVCRRGSVVPVQRCPDMTVQGICSNDGKECQLICKTWVKA